MRFIDIHDDISYEFGTNAHLLFGNSWHNNGVRAIVLKESTKCDKDIR